jgi:hypothetical protein
MMSETNIRDHFGATHTDVCTIDEAEEIEECNCRDDVQINLQAKSSLSSWVELYQRSAMSLQAMSF